MPADRCIELLLGGRGIRLWLRKGVILGLIGDIVGFAACYSNWL